MVERSEADLRIALTWRVNGVLSVRTVGDAAAVFETEHGAMPAHSLAGQCWQSEGAERVHTGVERWWPAWPDPGSAPCIADAP